MQQWAIDMDCVTFSFDNRTVLDGINLRIPRNQLWGLVGRSGVGKTTLLQIIAGLFRPTHGKVCVDNRNVSGPGRIRGIVFQEDALLGWLTVYSNALFPNHRNPSIADLEKAADVLRSVGLANRLDSYPHELSAGMRKRLEFARALLIDNEYLLADEPFGTLDALTRRDLWRMWMQLRSVRQRTGILCTHDPEEAVRLCDAVIILDGTPAHIIELLHIPQEVATIKIEAEHPLISELKQKIVTKLRHQNNA